jgi:organic hydroperoxide reductase OsmC/OhrA
MKIVARVSSSHDGNDVVLQTDGQQHPLTVPPKASGVGSSVNGGELLFLALATCYCNDLYREASRRGIQVEGVEVTVEGVFGGIGEPARNIRYSAAVRAQAAEAEILQLMRYTDQVAEIHNTLRAGTAVDADGFIARPV